MLLAFVGPPALSSLRRRSLLARCQRCAPEVEDLSAMYFYAVQCARALADDEMARLMRILDVDATLPAREHNEVAIGPRPGTTSPWSSKATDILKNCGLEFVRRVERGTLYAFAADTVPSADFDEASTVSSAEPLRLRRALSSRRVVLPLLYDRMIEAPLDSLDALFRRVEPKPLVHIPVRAEGRCALVTANREMGLALSDEEIDYALHAFVGRDPTDVELMMFAVVNSEHCRHKIFNADWIIDGQREARSLFDMIRHTHATHPQGTVKAYSDNAGVIEGFDVSVFGPDEDFRYGYRQRQTHVLIKVETHNHPTAIAPYPGASTGVGGEIRDEGAAGTGGWSQAGLCAFFTSHLRLPEFAQPWEKERAAFPDRLATPLAIMTEGPIGGAAFGNEFGRPNILGMFRTLEDDSTGVWRGYHKPIMVAGGVGLIDAAHVEKKTPAAGDCVIQLGGPAMLIGLGGGAASSMDTGANSEDLDFASVQRDNPEMQRRCQELISRCISLGEKNPIISIHDVGAGGLSNACPELVADVGARFDLRAIHNDDPGMSPMQIWSNEAQERYVLVVGRVDLDRFAELAARERCLFAVIGEVTGDGTLSLDDALLGDKPIDALDLAIILGKPPKMLRRATRSQPVQQSLALGEPSIAEAAERVLRFPAVAAKTFLITIADRTVTGLVARDQMVGPYQVPVADLALTCHSFQGYTGSAMAMGERTPLALMDTPASGRMAIAEAVTNIAAAHIGPIHRIKLSGNWMCACGEEGEDAALYDTVRAVGLEFCPALGVSIPVGKDSLSMRAVWEDAEGAAHKVVSPLSLVVSAFAPVEDVRRHATPDLKRGGDTRLLLADLGRGRNRLGGSCLAQAYNQIGSEVPDVDAGDVRGLYEAVQNLLDQNLVLAYHDRSDGGLFTAVAEMAFAGRCGVELEIAALGRDPLAALFCEEVGVVIQYRAEDEEAVYEVFAEQGIADLVHSVGQPVDDLQLRVRSGDDLVYDASLLDLHAAWAELTYRIQAHRDDPDCAREEYEALADDQDPGLNFHLAHEAAPTIGGKARPRVAVLREQGINGQVEMAAAFDAAACEAVDVTMTDLLEGRVELSSFHGLAACGGFSYGDVLGAGAGWARSILFHDRLREQFAAFFERPDTFSLGVCNGCQMLSHLKELIPGAANWPQFVRNRCEQFEARFATVEVLESRSVLLHSMEGSRLPIAVANGEGRVQFGDDQALERSRMENPLCL
ncbi:MAG: phosphoribosylformylglycinamidine synthase, partial [Gemmatimonadetes bacterium]|nr:phosphoribosylformylglycinamidine synthase [Gemmatimonadota bacterium]